MAGNVLYASLYEKDIHRLDLHDLPTSHQEGPELLNVLRFTDLPQIAAIAALLMMHRIDAVIATNTTLARDAVAGLPNADEAGGLSGAPVREASTRVIRALAHHLTGEVPIIGVGGILSGADAQEKIDAGASLVQLYSGLIYKGPELVRECVGRLGSL
jgi:dihydroorotate dehydrogenase